MRSVINEFGRRLPYIARENAADHGPAVMRVIYAALLVMATASPALAQREPVIVVPGKAGVPVYINGIDASWAIVEGQFGLDRPGVVAPTVTYRPYYIASLPHRAPAYHPASGERPGYGRLEVVPPPDRPIPPEAPTYYRSWSGGSSSNLVTQPSPYSPVPVVVEPRFGRHNPTPKSKPKEPTNRSP